MADLFTYALPPDRGAELQSLMAEHDRTGMSDDELQKRVRRMGAKPVAGGDSIIDKMAKLARAQKAMAGIVAQQKQGAQMGPPSPYKEAERVEPGVTRGMDPSFIGGMLNPADILSGMAGGNLVRALRSAPRAARALIPEVMGRAAGPPHVLKNPLPELPPRQLENVQIPDEVFTPPAAPEPRMAVSVGDYNPEQIAEQRRLAAPQLRLPPPTMIVSPEGVAARQTALRTKKVWPTLAEPAVSAKKTSRGVELFESGRGVQPPGEPLPRTEIPPTFEEQQREVQTAPESLPEILKRYALKEPKTARQQFGNVARGVFTSRPNVDPEVFPGRPADYVNPNTAAGVKDVRRGLRQFAREQFPSRAMFNKADFADRLERQRVRDTAFVSEGKRAMTPARSETRGRLHAASQLTSGDKVLTPQGPGTVIERVKGATTGRSINEIMASRGSRAEGRQTEWQTTRYATAPSASVKVKLDDGRVDKWSAWNLLRLKEEQTSVGGIPELPESMRAKIKAAKPKRQPGKIATAPEPAADEDFDWATGESKKP